ncbi:MAG: hypothetical protein AAFQ98_02040 [Bacteroidota bacterium]
MNHQLRTFSILFFTCSIGAISSCTPEVVNEGIQFKLIRTNTKPVNGTAYITEFLYSEENQLEGLLLDREDDTQWEQRMTYSGDFLISRFTIFDGESYSRDSLVYNAEGQVTTQYIRFLSTFNPPNNQFRVFQYNSEGLVQRIDSHDLESQDLWGYSLYQWEDGNLVLEQRFDEDDVPLFEIQRTFDDKNHRFGNLPESLTYPLHQSTNNELTVTYVDLTETGSYNFACENCLHQYTYDQDGNVILDENTTQVREFTWEEL